MGIITAPIDRKFIITYKNIYVPGYRRGSSIGVDSLFGAVMTCGEPLPGVKMWQFPKWPISKQIDP